MLIVTKLFFLKKKSNKKPQRRKQKNLKIKTMNCQRSENFDLLCCLTNRIAKLWLGQAENITASQTQQLLDDIPKSAVGLFRARSSRTSRSMICPSEENIHYLLMNA